MVKLTHIFLFIGLVIGNRALTQLETLENWENANPQQVFFDRENSLSENHGSLCLENTAPEAKVQPQRLFRLEPGQRYELSYYLKCEGVSSREKTRGACLLVCGADRRKWCRVPTNPASAWEHGTFDWKQGSLRFTSKVFGTDAIWLLPTLHGPGKAWFDRIELKSVGRHATGSFREIYTEDVTEAGFYPQGMAGFFQPGEPIRFLLELNGPDGEAEYSVLFKDYSGKVEDLRQTGKLTLPGMTTIEFPSRPQGYYIADAEIYVNNRKARLLQAGAVVAPMFGRRDPFFVMGYGALPEMHDALKRVGVGTIGMKFKYDHYRLPEHGGGKYVEDIVGRRLAYYRQFLESGDFALNITMGTAMQRRPEVIENGRPQLNDALIDRILACVQLLAKRTKGKVHEWDIGSEIPSDATIPKYCGSWTEAMFNNFVITRMVSRAIKAIDPTIKVYAGGNNIQHYTSKVESIVFGDLLKDVDGYFIDAYTGNWDMTLGVHAIPEKSLRSFYDEASAMVANYHKNPLIKNNETGYAINYGAPFDRGLAVEQAELTARTIILTKASPVSSFELHMPAWHTWNLPKELKDNDRSMTTIWKPVLVNGMRHDIPLPGGAMYATAARELAFSKLACEVQVGSSYACLFARADGKTVAAVWNTEGSIELNIPLSKQTMFVDMVGHTEQLPAGQITLISSTAPFYLVSDETPQKQEAIFRQAFHVTNPELKIAAKRHDLNTVTLFVRNPGTNPVQADVVGDGKKLVAVTVKPEIISTFGIPVCESLQVLYAGKKHKVNQELNYLNVTRLSQKPSLDGTGAWLAKLPPQPLRYPNDIYPKEALQPELCYFKTSFNPAGHNIAADFFLAYDQECLYLAVKVDDPVHLPKTEKGYFWEGDSIQWVISTFDAPPKEVRPGIMDQKKYTSTLNFGLAETPDGPQCRRFLGSDIGVRPYDCNVTRKDGTTFYEVAIPWRELGTKPKASPIRFSLVVFDKNTEEKPGAHYCLALTPGVARGQDAGEYRLLVFE